MNDDLGNRMKERYEDRTRFFLPRRTYTVIRLDGKAFHTLTKNLKRPYDDSFVGWMDFTTKRLCEEIQGVRFAYTQSDEISLLLTDFEQDNTEAWFNGNLQKIISISASIATHEFARVRIANNGHMGLFDSRAFTISDRVEVANYFIWRQKDCMRNSISMLAQLLYSHKELHKKSTKEMQKMCFNKGKNWNDESIRNKRGGFVIKEQFGWELVECPIFTAEGLETCIPKTR